jgi:hypothetical protein
MRIALAFIALAACTGRDADPGLGEPLRVRGGTFIAEPLPGLPPDASASPGSPAITLVQLESSEVRLGQAGKRISGRTSTDAVAVGIAFEGLGTGHWVAPVGPRDPTAGNEFTWSLDTTIGWDLPLGAAVLDIVAIDAAGHAGQQQATEVCVRPDLLDGGATCNPAATPPDTVLALEWALDVDLDLLVATPDGKIVGPSEPTTIGHAPPITQAELSAPGVGILDRDSNADCRIDGIAREALVWATPPAPGTYIVYANLASACGVTTAITFTATLYRRQTVDGASRLIEVQHQDGRLLPGAANGGRGPGLFLLQLAF